MQNLLGHSGGFSRNCSQLTVNCLTIVLLKFPDSDIDESAHLCSLHVLRSSGADRVTELNVVVTNLSCRRVLPACRAWRICFVSRKVLGISFKKIRHGVVNNETNRRFWYHNSWKNGILRITCLSVHVSTCLMTFTLKKWRYSGWKALKWRPRVNVQIKCKSTVKGNYGIGQITLLEVHFFF